MVTLLLAALATVQAGAVGVNSRQKRQLGHLVEHLLGIDHHHHYQGISFQVLVAYIFVK